MLILAVMLAYLGALGRHLGPKLLQLGPQEASRWSLEGVFFDVFWELFADVAGDPPKTPKMSPKLLARTPRILKKPIKTLGFFKVF